MFVLHLCVERVNADGTRTPVPLRQLDSFLMRNFTNSAAFDDTLPLADGSIEAGLLVPLDQLHTSMEAWFRRKYFLTAQDHLSVELVPLPTRRA